jgi:hypothetical protein
MYGHFGFQIDSSFLILNNQYEYSLPDMKLLILISFYFLYYNAAVISSMN